MSYIIEYKDVDDNNWKVTITQIGRNVNLIPSEDPVIISTDGDVTNIFNPTICSTATINFYSNDIELYQKLYGKSVTITKNNNIQWTGRIISNIQNADYNNDIELISVQAVDLLALSKAEKFTYSSNFISVEQFLQAIASRLNTNISIYYYNPANYYFNPSVIANDSNELIFYDILCEICKFFSLKAECTATDIRLIPTIKRTNSINYYTYTPSGNKSIYTTNSTSGTLELYSANTQISILDEKKSVSVECDYIDFNQPEFEVSTVNNGELNKTISKDDIYNKYQTYYCQMPNVHCYQYTDIRTSTPSSPQSHFISDIEEEPNTNFNSTYLNDFNKFGAVVINRGQLTKNSDPENLIITDFSNRILIYNCPSIYIGNTLTGTPALHPYIGREQYNDSWKNDLLSDKVYLPLVNFDVDIKGLHTEEHPIYWRLRGNLCFSYSEVSSPNDGTGGYILQEYAPRDTLGNYTIYIPIILKINYFDVNDGEFHVTDFKTWLKSAGTGQFFGIDIPITMSKDIESDSELDIYGVKFPESLYGNYIQSVEIKICQIPHVYTLNTGIHIYYFRNYEIRDFGLEINQKTIDNSPLINEDVVYQWSNTSTNVIAGEDYSEKQKLCSYNKLVLSPSNLLSYNSSTDKFELIESLNTPYTSNYSTAEQIRADIIGTQYSTPTVSLNYSAKGFQDIFKTYSACGYNDLAIASYEYHTINNQNNLNLIQLK